MLCDTMLSKLTTSSARSKNIFRHIGWSFLFKLGSVVSNFMMVPLAISYLGSEDYGVWLTLSSVFTWFVLFDIGLGNGLRNKFSEAKALGKDQDAQAFVSTAYYVLGGIGCLLVLSALLLNSLLDWTAIFNTSPGMSGELSILLPVMFSFFAIQLVAKLIVSIYQADQHHSIQDKVQFFGQALSLTAVWLLTRADGDSLLLFGSLYTALPLLMLLSLNVFSFRGRYEKYRPKIALCKKVYLNDIAGLGIKFFIIQIAAVVLFSTDNFIITHLFGPAEVVPYNIAFKYFSIVTIGYGVLVAPFWSSFTEAYAKDDMEWVKRSVSTIQKIWMLIPIWLFCMILASDWFYEKWIGDAVKVPLMLSLGMALFAAITTFKLIYVNFINGVGKIRLQMVTATMTIILNIPLSIYLAKSLSLGVTGVILATCICSSFGAILMPMQYRKIITNTAEGIWNK
jgi:O-antigen/teichoic acid export membrane protein